MMGITTLRNRNRNNVTSSETVTPKKKVKATPKKKVVKKEVK